MSIPDSNSYVAARAAISGTVSDFSVSNSSSTSSSSSTATPAASPDLNRGGSAHITQPVGSHSSSSTQAAHSTSSTTSCHCSSSPNWNGRAVNPAAATSAPAHSGIERTTRLGQTIQSYFSPGLSPQHRALLTSDSWIKMAAGIANLCDATHHCNTNHNLPIAGPHALAFARAVCHEMEQVGRSLMQNSGISPQVITAHKDTLARLAILNLIPMLQLQAPGVIRSGNSTILPSNWQISQDTDKWLIRVIMNVLEAFSYVTPDPQQVATTSPAPPRPIVLALHGLLYEPFWSQQIRATISREHLDILDPIVDALGALQLKLFSVCADINWPTGCPQETTSTSTSTQATTARA